MNVQELKEHYITGIRDILTALGVTEFYWYDLNLGNSPIIQENIFDSDLSYTLDSVEVDGVNASNCYYDDFWHWADIDVETIETIYNELTSMKPMRRSNMTKEDIKDICFGRDDLLAIAEQICLESGLSSADGEVLCEELARTTFDYLNWVNEPVE